VAVVATALLAGCSAHTVSVSPPSPSGAVAEKCAHLGDTLPQSLGSLHPRVISPRSPLVHAWGSPAVILTCGTPAPAGYSATSAETTEVDGVQWFQQRTGSLVVWTALRPGAEPGQTLYVRLQAPTHYQEQGAFLVDLAAALKTALP
jgi:hypothetical protein